jgi:hypothetical protein
MATVPDTLPVALYQGQTWQYVFERVNNVQTITLDGGPSSGTWQIRAYGTLTAALTYNASAATVQTALQLIPKIGGNGVTVARSGSGTGGSPYVYTLTWAGHFLQVPTGQRVPLQPLVEVVPAFSPASVVTVDYQPFDFTGWTMTMTVAPKNSDGTFGTTIVQITEATTASSPGRIYIGWVDPTSEGGTPGTADPTNGKIGLRISAALTATLTPNDFENTENRAAGWHQIVGTSGTWVKTFYDGPVSFTPEPS